MGIDLIFFLELEGYVKGYMGFYLQNGESYFENAYGSLALLLDFIYNLPMYLVIAFQIDNNLDCRNSVIFWAATMIASLGTLQYGAFGGIYGESIKPCTLMNIPYLLLPPYFLIDFMNKRRTITEPIQHKKSLKIKILDIGILILMVDVVLFNLVRYYATINSPLQLSQVYLKQFEPFLIEPTGFGASWPVFNLYGTSLIKFALCYSLFNQKCTWALDLSIVNLAFSVYGLLVHLGPQFHSRTSEKHQIPAEQLGTVVALNLMEPLLSVIVVLRCFAWAGWFKQVEEKKQE